MLVTSGWWWQQRKAEAVKTISRCHFIGTEDGNYVCFSLQRSIELCLRYSLWKGNNSEWTTSSFKLLDSNRQPVYYYNEHGQVEIIVITLKEFFKLTFLSFGIPNANRWDVEFSLSNSLKVLKNAWNSEIRRNLKQCLRLSLFHHKHAQSA